MAIHVKLIKNNIKSRIGYASRVGTSFMTSVTTSKLSGRKVTSRKIKIPYQEHPVITTECSLYH